MDGITEPVVLVLGHPIAGNPAQFALERAFESLDLQWRVLSCDVPPARLDEAIAGASILGFRGLLLDRNLCRNADDAEDRPDLYLRDASGGDRWESQHVLATWLESEIRDHFTAQGGEIGSLLSIGETDSSFPGGLAKDQTQSPIAWASAESIKNSSLITLSKTVDVSEWPECEGETLVVDFANPENDVDQLRKLGYRVIGREQMRIGILSISFQRWTGRPPIVDDLTEAIEEYLAV